MNVGNTVSIHSHTQTCYKNIKQFSNLTIFHQNIQHLESRKDSLEIVLEQIKPNVVVLTEHNMKTYEIERFNLNNFVVVSEYSRTTTSGGGVVILSERGLKVKPFKLCSIEELNEDKLFECCLAKCIINNFRSIIVGIYRKPQMQTSEFLTRLDRLMEILVSLKDQHSFFIAGDFNINVLNTTPDVKLFKNVLVSYGFYYLVDFPTRITATTSTAIDNILTNVDRLKCKVTGIVTALSDHDGQIVEFNLSQNCNNSIRKYQYIDRRDFSEQNMTIFCSLLAQENWLNVFFADVKEKFKVFENIFLYNFDRVFPLKTVKKYVGRSKCGWINDQLVLEDKEISELTKQAKRTNNTELLNYCTSKTFKL